MIVCAHGGCTESFPDYKWAKIRSQDAGWFHKKDGTAWCPKHIPAWVSGWRPKRETPHGQPNQS